MPKKHQNRLLQTKPPSSTPQTLASNRSQPATSQHGGKPSVNDLIRESRRLQLRSEQQPPPTSNHVASSVPPSLRAVLNLPTPQPPAPRPGAPSRISRSDGIGPVLMRRIPGPPPPKSWLARSLADSRHAPVMYRHQDAAFVSTRIQLRSSNLPDAAFPPAGSLQDLCLKRIAEQWDWHAENDWDYLAQLPVRLKEVLLSYVGVYADTQVNVLRALFLDHEDEGPAQEKDEVQRLDLSRGLGTWTTLKQLERDLVSKKRAIGSAVVEKTGPASAEMPDSWDAESSSEDEPASHSLPSSALSSHTFRNLQHLSLAVTPSNARAASWSGLISITSELSTLTSLSLAYWPSPTFTPVAAATRITVDAPHSRIVYGGTDMYSSMDNDWREAAGILRTLSRNLYCLKWLDLSGCQWWKALTWQDENEAGDGAADDAQQGSKLGPEWNGGWRDLERILLHVGWTPVPPQVDLDAMNGGGIQGLDRDPDQAQARYRREAKEYTEVQSTAILVARQVRIARKEAGGRWCEVDCGPQLHGYHESN